MTNIYAMVYSMLRTAVSASAVTALAAVGLAIPVNASTTENPCDLAMTFLCQFIPMAPDLDHDIDLTVDQPQVDPEAPLLP